MAKKTTKLLVKEVMEPIVPAIAIEEATRQYCQSIINEVNRRLVAAESMFKKGLSELKYLSAACGMNITSSLIEKGNCKLSVNILFEATPEEIRKNNEKKAIEVFVKGIMEKKGE